MKIPDLLWCLTCGPLPADRHFLPASSRRFRLGETTVRWRRVLVAELAEDIASRPRQPVTITRTGSFYDPRYGCFQITPRHLAEMVRNFNTRVYGQDIFIDVSHRPEDGAAAKITRLWVDQDRLLAEVTWTPYGKDAVTQRGYRYLSAEFDEDYIDNEQRQSHGATLLGAGLTLRPVIKRLDPVDPTRLSESITIHPLLAEQLRKEGQAIVNKYLKKLLDRLATLTLATSVSDGLSKAFTEGAKTLGDDESALESLANQVFETGKKLAEEMGDRPAVIQLTIQPQATLESTTEADVRRVLAEERRTAEANAAQLAKTLSERKTQFRSLMDASESIKALGEPQRTAFLDAERLITAAMTVEQVELLAQQQLKLAEQMAISAKLASLGWQAQGSTRIEMGSDSGPKKLQEAIDRNLKASYETANRGLRLLDDAKIPAVVRCILAEFDRINAHRLAQESRLLADGGTTTTDNMRLPAGFERTVLREALSDLNLLNLVSVRTDATATATTMVPYEVRRTGAVVNDGIVYESQEIPRASIEQMWDTAYVHQMKLSLKISNEAIHFSQHALIDWDAYARNVASNARIIQELVARRLANELQRSADAYGATEQVAENIAAQLTGSASLIKTSAFPIVRPKQERDLRGNAVGNPENPITLVVNGVTIAPYDGSGTQSAGLYYRLENVNLGFIRLVNQLGSPQTPTAISACTLTYWSANNLSRFDLKLPVGVALEDHLNGALRAFGARKALLSADRYIRTDFALMSPILSEYLTNARQFTPEATRAGSGLTGAGDLATIKAVSSYGTNAPGIDLGDERAILGERGTLSYTVVKPFVTGTPFEAVGPNGKPTGEKIAYGEEYNSIHVPAPLQNRLTSLLLYDSDARMTAA